MVEGIDRARCGAASALGLALPGATRTLLLLLMAGAPRLGLPQGSTWGPVLGLPSRELESRAPRVSMGAGLVPVSASLANCGLVGCPVLACRRQRC
ncbi:MAG TPA: hypothetical protein VNM90_02600, partial [Haliangium sp.]|nr:hypothetical protein [Haliangium sp.]